MLIQIHHFFVCASEDKWETLCSCIAHQGDPSPVPKANHRLVSEVIDIYALTQKPVYQLTAHGSESELK